jgi:hypothetical protein
MSLHRLLRSIILAALPLAGVSLAPAATITGVSSSQSPYLVGTQPAVSTISLLTVGDSVNLKPDGSPYRLVGIPDGLGAFKNHDGTFTLLMNHELPNNRGIVRDHGLAGAFVSKWIIDRESLTVLHGEDLIKHAFTWNAATGAYQPATAAFSRFCSADLAPLMAFYDRKSHLGCRDRIYLNGEESGTEGRAFAHLMNGNSYELPALGKFSWENSVANPSTGARTVVVGLDDGTGGQVYVYVGTKTRSSDPITAAGLNNGTLYGIKVAGYAAEDPSTGIPSGQSFTGQSLGNVSAFTGLQLEAASVAGGVTTFQRPEDGCWDPKNPRDFYFVTTASFTGRSRLWRLRFANPADPAAGGTIAMLLDGTEGPKMMDNITVSKGKVLIQEDPGNQLHLAKIWRYDLATGALDLIAQHDPARFLPGAPDFLTQDEESSGIIPLKGIMGSGWYLAVVQAHYGTDAELVEGGQLLALHLGDSDDDDHESDESDDDDHDD